MLGHPRLWRGLRGSGLELVPEASTGIDSSSQSWDGDASFYGRQSRGPQSQCSASIRAHMRLAAFLAGREGELALAVTVPSARPDIPRPNRAPPWAWPEPCGTTRSYLAGGDPGPTTGRQSRGSGRKVPLGSFLCGPLCFLSGCHLPKVMALWGTGAGR